MAGPLRIVLSGCSGGGKSTLLAALAARGHATVEEPGRRVVRAALAGQGGALPWADAAGFAAACIALAQADWERAHALPGPVFFDRSGHDAVFWLQAKGLPLPPAAAEIARHRFDHVYLTPPWPELRREDAQRRGSMAEAGAEYDNLLASYPRFGVQVTVLPKVSVAERIAFLAKSLGIAL